MAEGGAIMKNYKMLIRYDGTRYDGWQKQGNTDRTIQGKLENVLSKLCGCDIEVHGSGRTDAGVHAWGQVANAHMDTDLSADEIRDYLNQYLPADISVETVKLAPHRFHSRLNAAEKTYRYRIYTGKTKPVFERAYVWSVNETLSVPAMRQASEFFIGEHDFRSFCANKRMKKSTVRHIYDLTVDQIDEEIQITVTGNGFLHHMVRIMVGTLYEIGTGKRRPEDIPTILAAMDRQAAGITAPAQGLCLLQVVYEESFEK